MDSLGCGFLGFREGDLKRRGSIKIGLGERVHGTHHSLGNPIRLEITKLASIRANPLQIRHHSKHLFFTSWFTNVGWSFF